MWRLISATIALAALAALALGASVACSEDTRQDPAVERLPPDSAARVGGVVATAILPLGSGSEDARQDPAVERLLLDSAVRVAGVVVARPVVDLGHVPLDVVVEHTFMLRNAGTERVHLGHATVAVLEGC